MKKISSLSMKKPYSVLSDTPLVNSQQRGKGGPLWGTRGPHSPKGVGIRGEGAVLVRLLSRQKIKEGGNKKVNKYTCLVTVIYLY